MTRVLRLVSVCFVAALAAACGGATLAGTAPPAPDSGTTPPVTADASGACQTSADCVHGECIWPADRDSCGGGSGTCVTPVTIECNAEGIAHGCTCDGQTVGWAIGCAGPGGPLVPLAHGGACEDDAGSGSTDASAPPAVDAASSLPPVGYGGGASCLSTADCGGGLECAWLTSEHFCEAFNPAGTCVRPVDEQCNAVTTLTGCGCDGKNVTWMAGCVGLPSGWAPVGIAYPGSCVDAGT